MTADTQKLFRVRLCGLANSTGVSHHLSYVVAKDPTEAYLKVRRWLDEKDYGFLHDRELDSIELLAEDDEHTEVRTRLFL